MNYLHEYSTFESVEEMDEAISKHINRNQYELNNTDRDVLMTLARYSVKYRGVAHLKVDTIASIVGKSAITIRRAMNKLAELSIVEKVEFMRSKSGGNGANIYRILSYDDSPNMIGRRDAEKPTQASDEEGGGSDESINLLSENTYILETSKRASQPIDYIKRGLKNAIPTPIYKALAPFYDGKGLYDAYGMLLRAKARIDRTITLEQHADRYIDAFYNVIRRYKQGIVRNLDGYLFTAWERLSAEISRQKGVHEGDILAYNPYYDVASEV